MKIALVFDLVYPYEIGGVQKRLWDMATRLNQRGHEVTLFGMKYWEGEDIIYKEGVRLWGVCPDIKIWAGKRRSIKQTTYFTRHLLSPLIKERFDIIDCQNFPYFPCFPSKYATIIKKSHLVITWHEVWRNYWYTYLGKSGVVGKLVEKVTSHLTNNNISVSELTKNNLVGLGVKSSYISVIPNGIDFASIANIKQNNTKSDIIYAGRLIDEKHVDYLIKAVAIIKKQISDIKCIIIGDGPQRQALEKLASDLQLNDNIRFLGFLEDSCDVTGHMKASRVFVLPSTREGFGMVVLEANACGLPVITIEHPHNAAGELIKNGYNGYTCQLNAEDISSRIVTLLSAENKETSTRCIEYSRQYDWKNIIDRVEEFYSGIIQKSRPGK